MGSVVTTVTSMLLTPIHEFIYYVLSDSECHAQCGSSEACFACDCETEANEPLDGGETEVSMGDCCFIRHRE